MKTIRKFCTSCYGYSEYFSSCCNAEVDYSGNKCPECGKYCKKQPCDECFGEAYWDIEVGEMGYVTFDINSKGLAPNQIRIIKKLGHKSTYYKNYYTCMVKIIEIIDDDKVDVVIGEYGRLRLRVSIGDFSQY